MTTHTNGPPCHPDAFWVPSSTSGVSIGKCSVCGQPANEWKIGKIEFRPLVATASNSALARLAALWWAADAIREQDGGDPESETGWASDEALAHWLTIRSMIED